MTALFLALTLACADTQPTAPESACTAIAEDAWASRDWTSPCGDPTAVESYVCDGGSATTADELEAFEDCTDIDGSLYVSGDAASSLQSLSNLQSVSGTLTLQSDAMGDLDPLCNLRSVGSLVLEDVSSLSNIEGLANLEDAGEVLFIGHATQLRTIEGLRSLQTWTGTLSLFDLGADSLEGAEGLCSLGAIEVKGWDPLQTLEGFPAITALGGLLINASDGLTDLDGLGTLATVEQLDLTHNGALESLAGLSSLATVTDLARVTSNVQLCDEDVADFFSTTTLPDDTYIEGNLCGTANTD